MTARKDNEPISLSKQVEAMEKLMPGLELELTTAKATMLLNFGKEAKTYPEIVSDKDDLNMMIRLTFGYMHDRINELKSKTHSLDVYLRVAKQFIPVEKIELIDIIDKELKNLNHKQ